MKRMKVVLHFPKESVDKPLVYKLAKDFGLFFNILKAEVKPEEEGLLLVELEGSEEQCQEALKYIESQRVRVQPLSKDISMDKKKCVDCTVCVSLCPTQALEKDQTTGEVNFIKEKCIACGICVKACPYGAMRITF
ncbi:MAG: 4Fe-4S dicluster domain-containing protein [Candidatus Omnitrophica bacterium]|nr:4Fe-4S dicluster domain-containing protein [Candidatus Omnitrophota bacterium]